MRLCFALDLVDDPQSIEEYEQQHRPGAVWDAIIDDIRAEGFEAMQIWRTGNRLFMVAEVAADHPRGQRGAQMAEIYDRWQTAMDKYQERLVHVAPDVKWAQMECLFDLADHRGSPDPKSSPAWRR
jgi:L-rhamnose mutarotase